MTEIKVKFDSDENRIRFRKQYPLICGCLNIGEYSERYDACYCSDCNVWLDCKCGDPGCEFCADRPEVPNQNLEGKSNLNADEVLELQKQRRSGVTF